MEKQEIRVGEQIVTGYVVPLGSANLVFAVAAGGFLGCGAFDVEALEKFRLPAACVPGVSNLSELLAGRVARVNGSARARGVEPGMTGREALERF